MTAPSRASIHNIGTRFFAATPQLRRTIVMPAGALAIAMLIGACDRSTPTEAQRAAPTSSSQMRAQEDGDQDEGESARGYGDVAGVTAVVTAWDAAWNAGDANALAARFDADAEFINGRGQIASGAAAIRANHATSLAGVFRGSHTHGTIRHIVFLDNASAVVDVENELTNFVSLPPGVVPTRPGVQSGLHKRLVVRRGGMWRVVLMQITSIAPSQPTS